MDEVTYSTKTWGGEFLEALNRHPDANLIIGNNLGRRFVDIGDTSDYYYLPELEAVKQCTTKYILWYSGDVVPPETDWVSEALPLLETYPIVSCMESLSVFPEGIEENFETYYFSDQCYISKTDYMRSIDYEANHGIASEYPVHGGNSFERRVAQYLARCGTPVLVLAKHRYRHIRSEEK